MWKKNTTKQRTAMEAWKVRTPIHDRHTSIGPKWQRMNIECLSSVWSVCIVVSVVVAFGVRTVQLCFCVVASAFAAVGVRTLQLCFCCVASVFAGVGVRTLQLCFCCVASVFPALSVRTQLKLTQRLTHNKISYIRYGSELTIQSHVT